MTVSFEPALPVVMVLPYWSSMVMVRRTPVPAVTEPAGWEVTTSLFRSAGLTVNELDVDCRHRVGAVRCRDGEGAGLRDLKTAEVGHAVGGGHGGRASGEGAGVERHANGVVRAGVAGGDLVAVLVLDGGAQADRAPGVIELAGWVVTASLFSGAGVTAKLPEVAGVAPVPDTVSVVVCAS